MAQWERIVWLDNEIRQGHYPNAEQLIERFGVSRRTAFAAASYLKDRLHAPLVYSRHHKGWYYKETTFQLPTVLTNEQELIAFWLSHTLSKEYLGSPFADALGSMLKRILNTLPSPMLTDLGRLTQTYTLKHQSSISCSPELLKHAQRAIDQRRVIRIVYYSAHRDAIQERDIEPYHLLNAEGEWHCIAWCRWRRDYRQFLFSRVREWQLLEDSFEPKPEFDVQQYLKQGLLVEHGGELMEITLRFSPYQARWMRERHWHPSQRLETQPDGSLLMSLKVGGLAEIKRWILRYGAEVEVLSPPDLREQIEDEARKIQNLYKISDKK